MLHRAQTINMPMINHTSRESLQTDTELEYDMETPGGERFTYEQGQPIVSGAKKTPPEVNVTVSSDREEFKVGKQTFSITP